MAYDATVRGLAVGVDEGGSEGSPAVVLQARGRAIPIFIGTDQAKSISYALEGRPFERPLTHDLFVEMLTEFGGAIDRVRVDDLSGGTFLAKIDAERYAGGERHELTFDARPSDAIAVALRVECPVLVSEDVIEAAGRPPDSFEVR